MKKQKDREEKRLNIEAARPRSTPSLMQKEHTIKFFIV